MLTWLIHVFGSPNPHTLLFVNEIRALTPFSVLALSLMTVFKVGI